MTTTTEKKPEPPKQIENNTAQYSCQIVLEKTTPQVVYTHPEMFDANGQLVPDEILALRIETHDTDEENDD